MSEIANLAPICCAGRVDRLRDTSWGKAYVSLADLAYFVMYGDGPRGCSVNCDIGAHNLPPFLQ